MYINKFFCYNDSFRGGADFLVFKVRNGTMRKQHAQNIHVACNQSILNWEKVKMADRKQRKILAFRSGMAPCARSKSRIFT